MIVVNYVVGDLRAEKRFCVPLPTYKQENISIPPREKKTSKQMMADDDYDQ
jgi:hypothetical protein